MISPEDFADRYAASLLRDIGWHGAPIQHAREHPAISWVSSGLMDITGHANGPALMCPVPITAAADGALLALATLANAPPLQNIRGATLLGQRARLMKLQRQGRISPGGASRLMQACDGWFALTLARPEDWASIPAFLNGAPCGSWNAIESAVRSMPIKRLLQRAHLLGLPASRADKSAVAKAWFQTTAVPGKLAAKQSRPVVIDLSTLWAGPLCGQLLHRAGAFVVKVESTHRRDGARSGHDGFFDFLNAGKASAAFDFRRSAETEALRRMIERADIVIESARPRALRQLGLAAESLVAENPGLTWVSITGHGRHAPHEDRVGFGDDAAAAAGLCHAMQTAHGDMVFCGDAIADPLTGLHAALAAWASWQTGGGMVSLSLSGVTAYCVAQGASSNPAQRVDEWSRHVRRRPQALALPTAPAPARHLGADTHAVLSDFAIAC